MYSRCKCGNLNSQNPLQINDFNLINKNNDGDFKFGCVALLEIDSGP